MCEIDWSALGTWVVGLAAVVIAVQAHRFTSAAGERRRESDDKRCRAYSIAAFVEIRSLRRRAEGCTTQIRLAIGDQSKVVAVLRFLSAMPSFAPSGWLIESPSVGDLPVAVGSALAHAVSAAAEAERLRFLLQNVQRDLPGDEFPQAEAIAMLRGADEALTELVTRALKIEPMLEVRIGSE